MRARRSDWDSEVFGLDVGILCEWHPEWNVAQVKDANKEDFDVIFVKAAGWVDPPVDAVAQDHVFDMETAVEAWPPSGIARLMGAIPLRLLEIAEKAFANSRFLRDERLAGKAPAFYRRWCLDAKERILVFRGQEEEGFLIEGRDTDQAGRIELVAVDGTRRGRGIGSRIVYGAIGRPSGPNIWRVRVSSRNWKGIRFYERLGFMVRAVSTAFHIWT